MKPSKSLSSLNTFVYRVALPAFVAIGCAMTAPPLHAAGIGTVTHVAGEASAISTEGKTRKLYKGATLRQGDTAVTGKASQVDVRFSDDSSLQLRPESKFRIDEYSFKGKPDGSEKGFFSLLKGGFRAITGLIGRVNKSAYAVNTPTATIGIRGTEYTASLDKGNGLRLSVARGEVVLANNAGAFSVAEGQGAYVRNMDSAPVYLQPGGHSRTPGSAQAGHSGVQISGNTKLEAQTANTTAVAVGQGNKAANQAGVIGGD